MPRFSSIHKTAGDKNSLNALISSNKVFIFGHGNCYYSLKAKEIISSLTSKYTFFTCETHSRCLEFRDEILSTYGHRTFPAVFINGQFVGGSDAVEKLEISGELKKMINS